MSSDGKSLNARTKLIAARAMIRERNPYFAVLINGLRYVWVPPGSLGTMAITATGVVYCDEADVNRLTVEQLALSVLHEGAGHFLRDHADRKPPGADPRQWNWAGDAEINDDLEAAGWPTKDFPGGLITPEYIGAEPGLLAEQYYKHLREKEADKEQSGDGGGSGEGDESGEGGGDGAPKCGHGWCGSGAGRPVPNEPTPGQSAEEQAAAGTTSDQLPANPGRTQGEADRIRKAVADAIQKHEQQQGAGSVPGGFSRWADTMLQPPKIDWRTRLNQLVRDACAYRPGAVVTTWRKFGRRQAALGYGKGRPMTPAWHNPVPNVAVVIDTSGSMGQKELTDGISEIDGILRAVMADVQFVAIDSAVHSCTPVRNVQDIAQHLKGGGGTDFRPAFEELTKPRQGRAAPEVVIFVTDGDGPAPEVPPARVKVVWVLVGNYARKPYAGGYGGPEVQWGSFVKIDPSGEVVTEV